MSLLSCWGSGRRRWPDGGASSCERLGGAGRRAGRGCGLKPHLGQTWRLSADPKFIDKVRDIVGWYLDPPERALVLRVDEKSQIQALDRTAPTLPILPRTPAGRSHDDVRHGTASLSTALDVASGQVIPSRHGRHRHQEFLKLLRTIDRNLPDELKADMNAWNQDPKPLVWTKTADKILDDLTSYLQRTNASGHQQALKPQEHRCFPVISPICAPRRPRP
jgi:hypothetical protein